MFLLFKYVENKSLWKVEILKNSFKDYELTEKFPIKNKYFEAVPLLKINKINFFNLSKKLYEHTYLRFKIVTLTYPIRYDANSKYFLTYENEIFETCEVIDKKKYLKLFKC